MHEFLQMHTTVSNFPDHVAILRRGLVRICDGNHCAALLLDHFYEKTLMRLEYHDVGRYVRNFEPVTDWSITAKFSTLKEMMSDLFSLSEITSSLELLQLKAFTDIELNRLEEDTYVTYLVHLENVDDALTILRGEIPQSRIVPQEPEPEPTKPIITYAPRQPRGYSEAKRVAFHSKRAEALALSATLTLKQWLETLEYFNWHCAYCIEGGYQVFEHFIPLFHGGGTTKDNCVPACSSCNSRKSDLHPTVFEASFPKENLERVKQYLLVRRSEIDDAS